jgi:hypothetical protein
MSGFTGRLNEVASGSRVIKLGPENLVTEYTLEAGAGRINRNSPTLTLKVAIGFPAGFFAICLIVLLAAGVKNPVFIPAIGVLGVCSFAIGGGIYLMTAYTIKYMRIEVDGRGRTVNVVTTTATGKEKHLTYAFEQILNVTLILYRDFKLILINLKPSDSLLDRLKSERTYRLYFGHEFPDHPEHDVEGVPDQPVLDVEDYLRSLFLHVELVVRGRETGGRKILTGILLVALGFAVVVMIVTGFLYLMFSTNAFGNLWPVTVIIIPVAVVLILRGFGTMGARYKTPEAGHAAIKTNVILGIVVAILFILAIWFYFSTIHVEKLTYGT